MICQSETLDEGADIIALSSLRHSVFPPIVVNFSEKWAPRLLVPTRRLIVFSRNHLLHQPPLSEAQHRRPGHHEVIENFHVDKRERLFQSLC